MKKKFAIVAFSAAGRVLSLSIEEKAADMECHRYVFWKYSHQGDRKFEDGGKLVGEIFDKYDYIIFVGACAIAVRLIAPYLKGKTEDAGVLVTDEQGKYVISLLSGHIGGANKFAKYIAEHIGGEAVITTASDGRGMFSPDTFAVENDLYISDIKTAKNIAAGIINSKKIGLYSEYECMNVPDDLFICSGKNDDFQCNMGICISADETIKPFDITLNLIPKDIILGIGCKKGTQSEKLENFVLSELKNQDICKERICAVASIELKANEKAIKDFAAKYKAEFVTFTAEELKSAKGEFVSSVFVQEHAGVDNVCERSAVLCGGNLISHKKCFEGMTLAIAQRKIKLHF